MNTTNHHPDTELLDRLRSGLLDTEPERKSRIEAHLANCERCRRRTDWESRIPPDLLLAAQDLESRLDKARERAMRMPRRSTLPRLVVPLAAAASVALLAVVLVRPVQQVTPTAPIPQLAETGTREVPELYEELDFYMWLADHKANSEDSAT